MRENGFRAVGGLAQRLTSGIAQKKQKAGQGISIARLRAEWTAIVGRDLARISQPDALLSSRGRSGKLLRLRVPGAAALEVQHMSGQVVERVNGFFGYKMIDDIRIVQGALSARPLPPVIPNPSATQVAQAAGRTAAVQDPELRAVLARLGARVAMGRRQAVLGVLAAAFTIRETRAQDDVPRAKLLGPMPGDHLLGKRDAPNILIDYASLSCPHCANFYIAVMPTLKKDWIDTGKLLLIHRHFPLDVVATRAAQLTECVPPDKFFDTVERLFRSQVEWLSDGDPLVEMVKVLSGQGVTADQAAACFANDQILDKVIADVQSGQALGVRSTPSLFINDQYYSNPGDAQAIAGILRQVGR
jgi:hypothetical protein